MLNEDGRILRHRFDEAGLRGVTAVDILKTSKKVGVDMRRNYVERYLTSVQWSRGDGHPHRRT